LSDLIVYWRGLNGIVVKLAIVFCLLATADKNCATAPTGKK